MRNPEAVAPEFLYSQRSRGTLDCRATAGGISRRALAALVMVDVAGD
jgi:hypothetical protein